MLVLGGFAAALALGLFVWTRSERAFSPDRWQAREQRARIVDDLIDHHLVIGMSRESVVAMLGPPDASDAERSDGDEMLLCWSVGGAPPFGVDRLRLTFSPTSRLADVRTVLAD